MGQLSREAQIGLGILAVVIVIALAMLGWNMTWADFAQIWRRPILLLLIVLVIILAVLLVGGCVQQQRGGSEPIGMGTWLLIAFVGVIVLSGLMIGWKGPELAKFVYIVPIMFLFIAIGAFLLILLHYAATLHNLKPDVAVGALGLPDGSVRAFLAIGLLALVAVFGSFIYFESGKAGSSYAKIAETGPLSDAQQNQLRASLGDRFVLIYDGKTGTVVAKPDASQADLAKQILTMIATLLTTVVGFYFGSRSGEVTAADEQTRRKAAIDQITAVAPRTTDTLFEVRKKLDALASKIDGLQGDAKTEATTKIAGLRKALQDAEKDLEDAKKVAGQPPENTALITAARDKALAAERSINDIKQRVEKAENDPAKLTMPA